MYPLRRIAAALWSLNFLPWALVHLLVLTTFGRGYSEEDNVLEASWQSLADDDRRGQAIKTWLVGKHYDAAAHGRVCAAPRPTTAHVGRPASAAASRPAADLIGAQQVVLGGRGAKAQPPSPDKR